jgi:two-component system sensor histidine kinase RegB
MQFARTRVSVTVRWTADDITLCIHDDGPGFPPGLLGRLGEPYISARTDKEEHLGLGVFIALTLLERTGATLMFANAGQGGAEVKCVWQRKALERYTGD